MIYEILDEKRNVINTIIAEPDFVENQYKGRYRAVTAVESINIFEIPPKTLDQKIDELQEKIDTIIKMLKT